MSGAIARLAREAVSGVQERLFVPLWYDGRIRVGSALTREERRSGDVLKGGLVSPSDNAGSQVGH